MQLRGDPLAAVRTLLVRPGTDKYTLKMAVYAGFPAAVNALLVAKEVFAELDLKNQASNRQSAL